MSLQTKINKILRKGLYVGALSLTLSSLNLLTSGCGSVSNTDNYRKVSEKIEPQTRSIKEFLNNEISPFALQAAGLQDGYVVERPRNYETIQVGDMPFNVPVYTLGIKIRKPSVSKIEKEIETFIKNSLESNLSEERYSYISKKSKFGVDVEIKKDSVSFIYDLLLQNDEEIIDKTSSYTVDIPSMFNELVSSADYLYNFIEKNPKSIYGDTKSEKLNNYVNDLLENKGIQMNIDSFNPEKTKFLIRIGKPAYKPIEGGVLVQDLLKYHINPVIKERILKAEKRYKGIPDDFLFIIEK